MKETAGDYKIKDRSTKVKRRKDRMIVNGQSMKALLVENAAKAQKEGR